MSTVTIPATKVYRFERRAFITDGANRTNDALPDSIPEGAVIFNAPRPIYGDVTWRGDFTVGVFYALVLPRPDSERERHEPQRAWMITENQSLDATVIRPLTEAQARAEIEAHYSSTQRGRDYLARYQEGGLWERYWFDRWWTQFGWDTVEVTA